MLGIHLNLLPLPRDPNVKPTTIEEVEYLREVSTWLREPVKDDQPVQQKLAA
jgi:hypothetical protein